MGKGMRLLVLIAACVLIFVTVVVVAAIRETAATVREGLPEFAQTYLLIDGLPDSPAETVVQYREGLNEADGRNNRNLVWMLVAAGLVIGFFMFNMLIGPEGLKGLLREARLTRLAWLRNRQRPAGQQGRQPGDDDWVDYVHGQPPARPQLPVNNPWLLPAQAQSSQALDDNG